MTAIAATFSDWRPVKSRSVLQLIMEVPIEKADEVMDVLGFPIPGKEMWVGIARLNNTPETITPNLEPKEPRKLLDMKPSQQAGMLCEDHDFARWVLDQCDQIEVGNHLRTAAQAVRHLCKVQSRTELDLEGLPSRVWKELLGRYEHHKSGYAR